MERLKKEYRVLEENYKITGDIEWLYRQYAMDNFFEVSVGTYSDIVKYCKENNIVGVVDIGCATGYQSELFLLNNIDYIGIDCSANYFWNNDIFRYIKSEYPCNLDCLLMPWYISKNKYLGISSMCMSWTCYLSSGEKTLRNQFEGLARDFKVCLIYGQKENMWIAGEYFESVKEIKTGLYELTNK